MSLSNRAIDLMRETFVDKYTRRKNAGDPSVAHLDFKPFWEQAGAYRTAPLVCVVCDRELARSHKWDGHGGEFPRLCGDCFNRPHSLHLFDAVAAGRLTPRQAVYVMTWRPEPWWKRIWRAVCSWWGVGKDIRELRRIEWPDDMFARAEETRRELRALRESVERQKDRIDWDAFPFRSSKKSYRGWK